MSNSASQAAEQVLAIVRPDALHWKIWDDDCVVFNAASGETHVLDAVLALLVRQIDEGCSNEDDLFSQTAKLLDLDLTDEIRNRLEHMLRQLAEFGLIEFS